MWKKQHQSYYKLRKQMRYHMLHGNIQITLSQFSRGFYINLLFELQYFPSDQSRQRSPVCQRNSLTYSYIAWFSMFFS